jgi:hypothetical protein
LNFEQENFQLFGMNCFLRALNPEQALNCFRNAVMTIPVSLPQQILRLVHSKISCDQIVNLGNNLSYFISANAKASFEYINELLWWSIENYKFILFGEVRGTGKSDAEEFHEAMNTLNMGEGDIKSILWVISINLYFGNKKLKKHVSNQKMDSMLYDKFSSQ